jgi:hypothetical protein
MEQSLVILCAVRVGIVNIVHIITCVDVPKSPSTLVIFSDCRVFRKASPVSDFVCAMATSLKGTVHPD